MTATVTDGASVRLQAVVNWPAIVTVDSIRAPQLDPFSTARDINVERPATSTEDNGSVTKESFTKNDDRTSGPIVSNTYEPSATDKHISGTVER